MYWVYLIEFTLEALTPAEGHTSSLLQLPKFTLLVYYFLPLNFLFVHTNAALCKGAASLAWIHSPCVCW